MLLISLAGGHCSSSGYSLMMAGRHKAHGSGQTIRLIQAGGELADHPITFDHARDRAGRFACFADHGDEPAILEFRCRSC